MNHNNQASGLAPSTCLVEMNDIKCIGTAARSNEAEKIAQATILTIQGQAEGCATGAAEYFDVPCQMQVNETDKRPIETPKPLKVKKDDYKKKGKIGNS